MEAADEDMNVKTWYLDPRFIVTRVPVKNGDKGGICRNTAKVQRKV